MSLCSETWPAATIAMKAVQNWYLVVSVGFEMLHPVQRCPPDILLPSQVCVSMLGVDRTAVYIRGQRMRSYPMHTAAQVCCVRKVSPKVWEVGA